MAEINISQTEADYLLNLEKVAANESSWDFPTMGMKVEIPLISRDKKEKFLLDISRGKIDLKKITYQNRARQVVILARLDLSGPPHRNPDGSEVPPEHIHLYKEGFADKWAYAIPSSAFQRLDDQWQTLQDFMDYCNITEQPDIRRVMF